MTTNWDRYVKQALKEDDLRLRVDLAGVAWDIALQIAALRERRGLTQAQLAERMGTRQANVSRLESGNYRGYTLQTLDRVARALGARLEVRLAASVGDSIAVSERSTTTGDSAFEPVTQGPLRDYPTVARGAAVHPKPDERL